MNENEMSIQQINMTVTDNLEIVDWAMKQYIWSSKAIPDLSYEDLYQVGCLGLIKAIKGYNPQMSVKFSTYAEIVVKNAIIDYSRKILKREKKMNSVKDTAEDNTLKTTDSTPAGESSPDSVLSEKLILELLDSLKAITKEDT